MQKTDFAFAVRTCTHVPYARPFLYNLLDLLDVEILLG